MSITLVSTSERQAGAISSSPGIGVALALYHVVVTAVGDSGANLKLVTWNVSSDGKNIIRRDDSGNQAGTVDLLDIAGASNNRFVTAVRAGNGKLLLVGWQVDPSTGAVTRLGDSADSEGAISLVTMTQSPLGDGRVLIAVRDGSGNLVVKNWEVMSNGALKRVGDTALQGQPAGAISLVAISGAGGGKIVTAVRDSGGNLKLVVWEVLSSGGIKRLGDSGQQGEPASLLDVGGGEGYLVTAIRDGGGNLKLISWKISPDGTVITRVADSGHVAGGIDRLSCVSLPKAGLLFGSDPSRIVTAVRTKGGGLKLIVWQIAPNGAVTRMEDFDETSAISFVRMYPTTTDVYLTAVRDSAGNLKLMAWRFDLTQPVSQPDNLVAYDQLYFENTAQVLAPGATAPKGRIVLALGQIGRPRAS